jgi:hypothetical protein
MSRVRTEQEVRSAVTYFTTHADAFHRRPGGGSLTGAGVGTSTITVKAHAAELGVRRLVYSLRWTPAPRSTLRLVIGKFAPRIAVSLHVPCGGVGAATGLVTVIRCAVVADGGGNGSGDADDGDDDDDDDGGDASAANDTWPADHDGSARAAALRRFAEACGTALAAAQHVPTLNEDLVAVLRVAEAMESELWPCEANGFVHPAPPTTAAAPSSEFCVFFFFFFFFWFYFFFFVLGRYKSAHPLSLI